MLITLTGDAPVLPGKLRRLAAFTALGRASRALDLPLWVVTPRWRADSGWVNGWRFHAAKETFVLDKERITQRPVVYDAMYLTDLKSWRLEYGRCRRRIVNAHFPVFNPALPNKDELVRALQRGITRGCSLPRTWLNVHPGQIIELLEQHRKLWLKPTVGSGGRNILVVERRSARNYRVTASSYFGKRLNEQADSIRLRQILSDAFRRRTYLAQEHISLVESKDGRKIDFRVTVARTRTGEWEAVATTARYAASGSQFTNYHAGGSIASLTEDESEHEALIGIGLSRDFHDDLRSSGVSVAERLQGIRPMLGLLGVDLGYAQDGSLYVYDCNGRPGRDILTRGEVASLMNCVAGYSRYLFDKYR